jgi:hypothetical protein
MKDKVYYFHSEEESDNFCEFLQSLDVEYEEDYFTERDFFENRHYIYTVEIKSEIENISETIEKYFQK